MKADYLTLDGQTGVMECGVIKPQPMQHSDGFTLLGFETWEDVDKETIESAATNVASFNITNVKVGF